MRHRYTLISFLITLALIAPAKVRAESQDQSVTESEEDRCFDVAVIARVVRYVPTELPQLEGGAIAMRWPWYLDISVEEVVVGAEARQRLRLMMVLHGEFNSEVEYFIFLLRKSGTDYSVV